MIDDEPGIPPSRLKSVAKWVFPQHSSLIERLNHNAKHLSWLSRQKDVPRRAGRSDLYRYINDQILKNRPVDYLEFGVFRGASLRKWCEINTAPQSRFFGFDSFEGLPEGWGGHPRGTFDVGGRFPDIPDPRLTFIKGWFQETVPAFLEKFEAANRIVIHNDSDLYSSTLYVLAKLDPVISPGTVIIFDDFHSPLHEFRALNDYTEAFDRKMTLLAHSGRYADQAAFLFL